MTTTRLPKTITAGALLATPIPPVKWIIPGLLPAGLAIFAGSSKAGKSWLTLWLCLQISQGKSVWGREIEPRTVLYFSLEDTLGRLQERLYQLVDAEEDPERLILQTESHGIGQGLEEQIVSFIHTYSDISLIVIDTLQKVRKTDQSGSMYTPKQAEKWVREQAILFEREVQHTPEPINRSITLAKYIEHWAADIGPKKLADSTFRRDEQDIRRILPALGNYKLTDLRKEVSREFYEEMRHTPRLDGRGNLSEKSVEGLHNTLCSVLSSAVDEGYLTHNPAWRCYKPKGQKKERPVADEKTVKKLITAFEGQSMKYETYFKLVLATGLRRGEACGLKWSDINWRKRTIHVQRGVVKLSHQESITKDPKTSSGDRMVYLSKEMCQLLKAWRKECEWDRQQTANETVSEDDYLFRQSNGKPMNPCTFTYRFKLILKANNLPLDLNVHSLRHTNASLLIAQGVDVRTVASLLGHAQASTTLDIYAHAFDKNKRKAQEKLGKAIGL